MAQAKDLMGLGMPDRLAALLGNTPATLTGVGTSQAGATLMSSSMADLITSSGQTAFVFSATTSLTRLFFLCNTTATTALIFPPVGGAINNGSTDASVNLAQNKTALFWRNGTLTWRFLLTA